MPAKKLTIRERLFAKRNILPNGCWEYTGFITETGYGQFGVGQKHFLVHRVSYEEFVGSIPDGLTIDHKCHTVECAGGKTCPHRRCFNPDHLGPETNRDNILRGVSPSAQQARQTHCKNGHALEGQNLKIKTGHRLCRECIRDYKRSPKEQERQRKHYWANLEKERERNRKRYRAKRDQGQ